ncbi:MAG: RcnB family protein [Sphingobium sp.]|mgnify:CR=1 FL=1|nr:RcnB family protein [Sphingobium sp.]MCP5398774.1 RcnB family protein [Sphingomonas sp.]
MRKIITAALIAATAIPVAAMPEIASAQSRREVRESYRDLKEERRDLRRAYRYGDRRDIKRERRDVRRAEKEYSRDLHDYRRSHRNVYRRGHWDAPFRYKSWNRGSRIDRHYYHSRYYVNDPWRYRLPRTRSHYRWVRHYDDVLLINIRNGRVVDVLHNFFW